MTVIVSEHLTEAQLLDQIEEAKTQIEVGAFYAHYRNPNVHYKVLALTIIEATQEVAVVYQKQHGSDGLKSVIWVRPVSSWLELVQTSNGEVPRFHKVLN